MKKSKLYLILAIITAIILFATAAICNQCSQSEELTPPDEEPPPDEVLLLGEEPPEEPPGEEPPPEEEPTEEELSEPTIDLEIYDGPFYSEADEVCYYRVKAIVTGNPTPSVKFSKDDSFGAWGKRKCQINLHNPSETYTLTATVSNSEGEDSDSIEITWGCEEEPEDEEETVFEGWSLGELSTEFIFTLDKIILHPNTIGYIVWPDGINTETAIIGDSISNTEVTGYFGFDLSSISERAIDSATLKLKTYKFWSDCPSSNFGHIHICLGHREIFPLNPEDWFIGGEVDTAFAHTEDPIVHSRDELKNAIQERLNEGRSVEFYIFYYRCNTDGDHQIDGREYRKEDITLTIEFSD